MGWHCTFRADNTTGSKGKRSADRALDRRDPSIRVSREAHAKVGSLSGRAARILDNEKGGSEVMDGALEAKGDGVYPRESG